MKSIAMEERHQHQKTEKREEVDVLVTAQPSQPIARPLHRALTWCRSVFLENVLGRKTLPPSKNGRVIPLRLAHDGEDAPPLADERRGGQPFVSNTIRTSRYTFLDFLPKQLLFQFSRLNNFYFLCVGVPQTIPGISTTGNFTTILPLLIFVFITIAKEGYDDFKRHKLDRLENAQEAKVIKRSKRHTILHPTSKTSPFPFGRARRGGTGGNDNNNSKNRPCIVAEEAATSQGRDWSTSRWSNIQVGDIVKLSRDEAVPADIVLLHADGENGLAYIETMALDGETSLKSRQISPALEGTDCNTVDGILACDADFVLEDPNPDLTKFDGRLTVNHANGTSKTMPLTSSEIIYRGCILRNTAYAIGLVINTGQECKIRLNADQHPKAKRPALETVSNKIVVSLALYLIAISVGCSMSYLNWQESQESKTWYLEGASPGYHQIVIGYFIQFNNVIPLALYVSLEIVKVGQLLMLNSDLEMYHAETDTPARCNTNTILENLGQVGYVFTDKTGTLTENVMKFRKLSIAGTAWLHEADLDADNTTTDSSSVSSVVKDKEQTPRVSVRSSVRPIPSPTYEDDPIRSPRSPVRHSLAVSARETSMGRRSSSQWRSSGRPDHVQPDVTTRELLEFMTLRPHAPFTRRVRDYILAMALCHTCLPEVMDGDVEYQASSPDELAIIKAARDLGYTLVARSSKSITLRLGPNIAEDLGADAGTGQEITYEILDVIEFSSIRKRMSVIVKYPDGRTAVLCKGADSVVIPRLKLAEVAKQKASDVRKSSELNHEQMQQEARRSSVGGPRISIQLRRSLGFDMPSPTPRGKPSLNRGQSLDIRKTSRQSADMSLSRPSITIRAPSMDGMARSPNRRLSRQSDAAPDKFAFLDHPAVSDDSAIFSKCFQHLDEFASEGLRTLLFAQRFISDDEYQTWKKAYDEAATSLTGRQERTEEVAELIEHSFDLVGASAIEDELQKGVPETIDSLRRANIKIWMLTGDKRETAINIAHAARLCQPTSDLYTLDSALGCLREQLVAISEDLKANSSIHGTHSVVVVEGNTLADIEETPDLCTLFYASVPFVDTVICCRASPAQKALLVKTVRSQLRHAKGLARYFDWILRRKNNYTATPSRRHYGLTLAIGDGANDLAMISASHVGVGISGKEGLQASRVADYAIAQFEYLQRLLLVHGRWNYVRTAKFILCTFWKVVFFYLPTAMYQRANGFTGTSLYEMASLTVFNTLFTSLCTICMGIWEQDLSADTLLAVPELYVYGQRSMGLNLTKYTAWMFSAACQGILVYWGTYAGYVWFATTSDQGLYAVGNLTFSIGIAWINYKLFFLETHYKSSVVLGSFFITFAGWWAWQAFLSGVYERSPSPYAVRDGFDDTFGRDPYWWLTFIIVTAALIVMETIFRTFQRSAIIAGLWNWPWAQSKDASQETGAGPSHENMAVADEWRLELWQELEKDPVIREKLRRIARREDVSEDDEV